MKKILLTIFLITFMLLTVYISLNLIGKDLTNDSNNINKKEFVEIGWYFEVSTETDQNGTEAPYTNLSILINNEKFEIKEVFGYPTEIKDFESLGMPNNTILACRTWFGGSGIDFYVKELDNKTLEIMWRNVDESDSKLQSYSKLKEINFSNEKNIKTIEPKIINQ